MHFRESDNFKVSLINNSYFFIEIKADVELEIEDIVLIVKSQKELAGGSILPSLIYPSSTATTNIDVLKYLAQKSNLPYTKANAYILNSMGQKILANLYTKATTPQRPTQFFNNKEDALNWLEQFFE